MKSFRYVTMQRYIHPPACLRKTDTYVQIVQFMGEYVRNMLKICFYFLNFSAIICQYK
jgi:hypothetical protein